MNRRKLTLIILWFVIMMSVFAMFNVSKASTEDENIATTADTDVLGYLKITRERTVQKTVEHASTSTITYRHQIHKETNRTRNVWKLVACDQNASVNGVAKKADLYCLRAGLGFTASDVTSKAVLYNQSYDMNNPNHYSTLRTLFNDTATSVFNSSNSADYYAVLWILDNMLLEGATQDELITYLTKYTSYTEAQIRNSYANYTPDILTRADIEAIQQLAIWYFTNKDEADYHQANLPTLRLSVENDWLYYTGSSEYTGTDNNGKPVYKEITQLYNLDVTGEGTGNTNYGTIRQNRANELYRNLVNTMNEAVKNSNHTYTARNREITVWLAGNSPKTEQPVVQVKELPKEADISLRKFIYSVNGEAVDRAPTVDTTKLNKKDANRSVTNNSNI